MKCKVTQVRLLDYIDGKLSAEISQKISHHLSTCETCEKMYERYQKTHEALSEFGGAVRAGIIDMEAPSLPQFRQNPFWEKIWSRLKTPVPVWIPSAAILAVLLIFTVIIFSPLNPPIERGPEKGGGNMGSVTPPLAAEAMLEFLIVPDPTDFGQLAASVEAVEKFMESHPEDLAMHAKLVELYQAQLNLKSLSEASRTMLTKKLSIERARFIELLEKTNLTKGVENAE